MESKALEAPELHRDINGHRLRFLPPDTVEICWNGRCTRNDFKQILAFSHAHTGDRALFVVADVSQLKSVDADARKEVATDPRIQAVTCIAIIGSTFHTRVLMMMVTTAIEILNHKQRGKLRFFDSKGEESAWFAEERARLGRETGTT